MLTGSPCHPRSIIPDQPPRGLPPAPILGRSSGSTGQRFRWPWKLRPPAALLLAFLLVAQLLVELPTSAATALAQSPATPVAEADPALVNAVAFLLTQQVDNGGFSGLSGEPDPGATIDAVIGLAASTQRGVPSGDAIERGVAYLEGTGSEYAATGSGQAARLVLAVVAAGQDPAGFGGVDLIAALTGLVTGTPAASALAGDSVYSHALVLLALAATRQPVPPAAITILRETQLEDGSWGFTGATDPGTGDSNTTAIVIQALVATGHQSDPMLPPALGYLASVQTGLGQFLYQPGPPEMADANSTALVVQAVIAAGEDPASADWSNAARGLAAFQNVSGAFRYTDSDPSDNLLATLQAVPALAGVPLPVMAVCPDAAEAATSPIPDTAEEPVGCAPLAPAA